jgi:YD repeat-containing protein
VKHQTIYILLLNIFILSLSFESKAQEPVWTIFVYCFTEDCIDEGITSTNQILACERRRDLCQASTNNRLCKGAIGAGNGVVNGCVIYYWGGSSQNCPAGYIFNSALGNQGCLKISESSYGISENNTCKPINIVTGNKYYRYSDYNDSNFSVIRSYNSVLDGWRFNYQQKLSIKNDSVRAIRSDGKDIEFVINGDDFVPDSQRRERLSFDGLIYTLTLPDNKKETYNNTGQLLAIIPLFEASTLLSYSDNLMTVSKNNHQLLLATNNDNQVTMATFSDGTVIAYEYTVIAFMSVLSRVIYPNTTDKQYLYENTQYPTYVTGIADENGNRISSVQYDYLGRAISSEAGPLNSGIERTQIQYNADGTRTLTNALGKQNIYHFTQFNGEYKMTQVEGIASDNCAAANKNYTYDANGFMESKTDWKGNTTTYIHNDRGQELSRVEASGTPHAHTITTEWHAEFNLPIKIIESARETIMAYDANGRLLSRNITER